MKRQPPEYCQPYTRTLPGGGYVAIEVTAVKRLWRSRAYEGRVVIERRGIWRRESPEPPVIATASGDSVEAVVRKLLPTAQCDPVIGSALLRAARAGAAAG